MNENDYPTMKLMRCKKCGNIFAASMTGFNECPECSSEQTGNLDESDSGAKQPPQMDPLV